MIAGQLQGLGTVIVGREGAPYPETVVWVGKVSWDTKAEMFPGIPATIEILAAGEGRYIHAETLEMVAPHIWQGTRHFFGGETNPVPILIRPTRPDDAMTCVTTSGAGIHMALPLPVLDYLLTVEFTMPKLYALAEDDGFVATMMLDSEPGIYIRYSGAWHQITDEEAVDGLSVYEVEDTGLDLFDQYDRQGQLVGITAMPTKEPPIVSAQAAEAMAASVGVRSVPSLDTLEDLPGAIAAAADNPELQWWVERRAKALGASDVQFPW